MAIIHHSHLENNQTNFHIHSRFDSKINPTAETTNFNKKVKTNNENKFFMRKRLWIQEVSINRKTKQLMN